MCASYSYDAGESKFTGKERDAESNLDYFGARHYASTMGRWMSPDLVNVTEDRVVNPANTLNKYVYGLDRFDPSFLTPVRSADQPGASVNEEYRNTGIRWVGRDC
jgi:RHS repeat-associated protein